MVVETNMSAFLWKKVLLCCTYLQNRHNTKALSHSTPYQELYKAKPNLADLWVIGLPATIWVPKEYCHKLKQKSLDAILVGFDNDSKAYHFYCLVDRIICL